MLACDCTEQEQCDSVAVLVIRPVAPVFQVDFKKKLSKKRKSKTIRFITPEQFVNELFVQTVNLVQKHKLKQSLNILVCDIWFLFSIFCLRTESCIIQKKKKICFWRKFASRILDFSKCLPVVASWTIALSVQCEENSVLILFIYVIHLGGFVSFCCDNNKVH